MSEWLKAEIKKKIDDLEKKYCIEPKCHGLLDCKICMECEVANEVGVYKFCMGLLDGVVCIPEKTLKDLFDLFPCQDVDNIYAQWLRMFKEKLLGSQKQEKPQKCPKCGLVFGEAQADEKEEYYDKDILIRVYFCPRCNSDVEIRYER